MRAVCQCVCANTHAGTHTRAHTHTHAHTHTQDRETPRFEGQAVKRRAQATRHATAFCPFLRSRSLFAPLHTAQPAQSPRARRGQSPPRDGTIEGQAKRARRAETRSKGKVKAKATQKQEKTKKGSRGRALFLSPSPSPSRPFPSSACPFAPFSFRAADAAVLLSLCHVAQAAPGPARRREKNAGGEHCPPTFEFDQRPSSSGGCFSFRLWWPHLLRMLASHAALPFSLTLSSLFSLKRSVD